jgi:hypothetical protein
MLSNNVFTAYCATTYLILSQKIADIFADVLQTKNPPSGTDPTAHHTRKPSHKQGFGLTPVELVDIQRPPAILSI